MQTPGRGWWCDDHQRHECVIPRSHNRGTCHGSPVGDTDRCRMHLGTKAQPVIADAKLREQAADALARLDVPPVDDPLRELARLAGQAVAWKDEMAGRVNALGTVIRYQDAKGAEQLRGEIQLWERALDRCVSTLTAMARLNIDERMTGVRERTADMLVRAIEVALTDSGLDLDAQWRVKDVFRSQVVLVRPLSENPEATQAEFVEAEIRDLEGRKVGWGDR